MTDAQGPTTKDVAALKAEVDRLWQPLRAPMHAIVGRDDRMLGDGRNLVASYTETTRGDRPDWRRDKFDALMRGDDFRAAVASFLAADAAWKGAEEALRAHEARQQDEARERAARAAAEYRERMQPTFALDGERASEGRSVVVWVEDDEAYHFVTSIEVPDRAGPVFHVDDEPSSLKATDPDLIDLKAPTADDLSRIFALTRLEAKRLFAAIPTNALHWYVYDPTRWERVASEATEKTRSDSKATRGTRSSPPPASDHTGQVGAAKRAGAKTTAQYAATMGVSLPTARSWLRDAGGVEVKTGRSSEWTVALPESVPGADLSGG